MALRVQDVITEDFVRETVEEVVEEELIYRRAFREIDASSIQSNSYTFYIDEDNMGEPQLIGEGEEFPRTKATVKEVTVQFEKFGDSVAITMEAMEDGMIDMKARQVEDLARKMAEDLNSRAYTELDTNARTTDNAAGAIGDGNSILSFADILAGMKAVRENGYQPDMVIVDLDGYVDLMQDDNFNRATQAGDEVVRSGEVGRIAGMPVVVDSVKAISGGHGAFVVDSARYGYELTRTPVSTNEYTQDERQADVIQIYTRKAWTTIFPEAAAKVDG